MLQLIIHIYLAQSQSRHVVAPGIKTLLIDLSANQCAFSERLYYCQLTLI